MAKARRIPLARLAAEPSIELASNGAIKRAIARCLGISIIWRYAISLELELRLLVELLVVGFPLRRQWHLVYPRDKRLGFVDQAFLEFIGEGTWRASLGESVSTD